MRVREDYKRTYMDMIRNMLVSAVLVFTTGTFLSAQGGYTVRGVV